MARVIEVEAPGCPWFGWSEDLRVDRVTRAADAVALLRAWDHQDAVVCTHAKHPDLAGLVEAVAPASVLVGSEDPSVAEAVAVMRAGAADYVPSSSLEVSVRAARLRGNTREGGAEELASLQAALVERERLATVGQLAAGVAHEINNPSAVVLANLDEIKSAFRPLRELIKACMDIAVHHAPPDELVRVQDLAERARYPSVLSELLEMIHESVGGISRIRAIVQDLKGFSQVDDEDRVPLDLRRLLERVIGLTRNEMRLRASVDLRLDPVPPVLGSPGRLSQALLQVLDSVVRATGEDSRPGRRVRVSCASEAGVVVVRISDNAPPAPGVDMRRSMGLAVARDIIQRHGGHLDLEEGDAGRRVRIRLPSIPEPSTAFSLLDDVEDEEDPITGTTVLVVDDEPQVRSSLARVMRAAAVVHETQHGREALDWLLAGHKPDLVICDLMMPEMDGAEFFEALQARMPAIAARTLFLTGGPITARTRRFAEQHADRIVEKPVAPEDLRRRARLMLRQG